eukprot:TRINITY_DN8940_c0_g1_i2.p1 TRINITY_DN8940_c0_g1~~TRINITY_DN8940_c0_g1_i2.p1  ORF type:complete len:264 (+),score=29.19 TRINITY_DN8940_c0_g1_i2:76-867(+)
MIGAHWGEPASLLPDWHTLQSGDLLLFSSTWPITLPVRVVLSTRFSHVGLVVRKEGVMCVLESMPFTGVTLFPLEERMHNLGVWCPLLVGRRLMCPRLEECVVKLDDWVDKIVGKSYDYNIPKLGALLLLRQLQEQSGIQTPFLGAPADESNLSCSELVASAYQAMGLLPDAHQPQQYSPAHFLGQPLQGATLGDRFPIAFRSRTGKPHGVRGYNPSSTEVLVGAGLLGVGAMMLHRWWDARKRKYEKAIKIAKTGRKLLARL